VAGDLTLRLGAVALALASFAGAAGFVAGNLKNPAAPLQPPVARPVATPSAGPTGRLRVAPAVRATELPAITITHVS